MASTTTTENGHSRKNGHHDSFSNMTLKPCIVGCIGGGQLGRMMSLEAPRLNINMYFLDALGENCPAASTVPSSQIITGGLYDAEQIYQLAFLHDQVSKQTKVDVLTVEIEHINVDVLEELETIHHINVQPASRILRIIQDKYMQKEHFAKHSLPLPPYHKCSTIADIEHAVDTLGLPLMLKSRKGAYDGRGNAKLDSKDDIISCIQKLVPNYNGDITDLNLYAEGWIHFDYEIAVMVVRSSLASSSNTAHTTPTTACYPAVNAIQQDSICRVVIAPAVGVADMIRYEAERIAIAAIDSLGTGASGMFGVELFVADGVVYINEVAPRPHNTGHYTQNACSVNQFENHLRAICGYPLGNTTMVTNHAVMINVLGSKDEKDITTLASSNYANQLSSENNADIHTSVHWYAKKEVRSGRKMGHINLVTNQSLYEPKILESLYNLLDLEQIPRSSIPINNNPTPVVGIIMGSHSDLPTMQDAVNVLKEFNIPYEVDIVSAHRTPLKLMEYSTQAAARGLQVIIAGAGGAAHLPGMVASLTPLPVIGVPILTSTLSGVDSLYSIVQMPKGIPVATVAIGNATNAGLLAVRMLGSSNRTIQQQMKQYQTNMTNTIHDISAKLLQVGSDQYLAQMDNKNKSVNV